MREENKTSFVDSEKRLTNRNEPGISDASRYQYKYFTMVKKEVSKLSLVSSIFIL